MIKILDLIKYDGTNGEDVVDFIGGKAFIYERIDRPLLNDEVVNVCFI